MSAIAATPQKAWPPEGLARVPYWVYQDATLYAEEQKKIFRGATWNFLCLDAELPGPETWRTSNIGEMPVVVTRDANGELAAFENRCAHRGALLCLKPRGEAKEIAYGALYLASDESSFVTGTEFMVDGGITAAYVTPE